MMRGKSEAPGVLTPGALAVSVRAFTNLKQRADCFNFLYQQEGNYRELYTV